MPEKKSRIKRILKNQDNVGFLYIAPWLIGFILFQLYPLVASLIYSFTDYNLFNPPKLIGLQNYIYMFTKDELFGTSLKRTFLYVLMCVPFKLIFALFIAMLLNAKLKFINVFRTIYYLPSIIGGSVAISILWRVLFAKEGVINNILGLLNIKPIDWLGDPDLALFTISLIVVWQFGSSMVIFLASLRQIPTELYEAAKVDGASKIRTFFSITVPLITPVIFFNLVMGIIDTFQDFTGAMVVTNGGPLNQTYLYMLKLYDDGFKYFKMGYASALSWILFIIILLFTSLIFKSSPLWVHYQDGDDC